MSTQLALFGVTRTHDGITLSITREARAKDRGIRAAEAAHQYDLQTAREIARDLARDGRAISADDVRAVLAERHPEIVAGNWMGGLFRSGEWQAVGMITSATPGSHGNRLLSWRLR